MDVSRVHVAEKSETYDSKGEGESSEAGILNGVKIQVQIGTVDYCCLI
jgi:hypothetical protein